MSGWRQRYLSIDPRTLGLLRIALGLLLLLDLAKRAGGIGLWYVNSGLLPNHRLLWQPRTPYQLSYLYSLFTVPQVEVAFALMALVYLAFLLGLRTRLMHLLAWLCLLSLHTRADMLANGGDYVFCTLVLWSAFLPLGRRFSLDALRRAQPIAPEPAPDTRPVVSLAALALYLQLAVIYLFNALHKQGETWREGSAVHYLVHQARIVTAFGVWLSEHAPLELMRALSYGTLVVEYAIPLLILLPWLGAWPRRVAVVVIWSFHGSIALLANLGVFSPVMMVFALALISREDWRWLEGRASFQRLHASSLALFAAARSHLPLRAAELTLDWARSRVWLREGTLALLLVLALSQLIRENRAMPRWAAHEQPRFVRAAISYLRLNQGWSMFAPEAPDGDMWLVIDAVTADGRHLDPLNARGSRVADARLRVVPRRLDHDVFFCDYVARIVGDGVLHDSLSEWIFDHHRRVRRPADRIVRFDAYVVEHDSPPLGAETPTNTRSHVFLSRRAGS